VLVHRLSSQVSGVDLAPAFCKGRITMKLPVQLVQHIGCDISSLIIIEIACND
jgi:hypothetical protein